MEVLELKPIKNKIIILYLVETENHKLSKAEAKSLEIILENNKINLVTVDFEGYDSYSFKQTQLYEFLKEFDVPFTGVDIPEYAKGYLDIEILERKEQIEELEVEYKNICSKSLEKNSFKAQNLKSWIDLLKQEVKEKEKYLKLKIKPQWIVKKILEMIRTYKENSLFVIHLSLKEQVSELEKLFKGLGIGTIVQKLDIKVSENSIDDEKNLLTSTQIIK